MPTDARAGATSNNVIPVDFRARQRADTPRRPDGAPGVRSGSPRLREAPADAGVRASSTAHASGPAAPLHPTPASPATGPKAPPPQPADGTWRSLWAELRRMRPHAWPMAQGLAVVAGTSLAAALTVTADLLQLGATLAKAGPTAPLWTTRTLGAALGALGPQAGFAVIVGMVVVAGLGIAAIATPGSREAWVGRTLAAVGLGTALSPFWLVAASGGVSVAAPGLLLACACVVGLQALAVRLEHHGRLSPLGQLATSTALAAALPLGAGIAIGLGPVHCTLAAGTALALGMLGGSSLLWLSHLASTDDRGGADLRRTEVPVDRRKRLALPGEAKPTVFVDHPELRSFVDALRARRDAGLGCEGLLLLEGPAGTGKSDTAQAVANLGPWAMYQAPLAALLDAHAPEAVLVPWFEQLRARARRTERTQVAFLDEAELLLRAPADQSGDNRARALVGAFADLLGELQLAGSNVLVVVGTNHPGRLAPKVWQRFVGGSLHAVVPFAAPSPVQLAQMVPTKLTALHAGFRGLRAVHPFVPSAAFLAEAGEALARRSAVGRDVAAAVDEALTAANATFGRRWRRLEQAQFDAFVERYLRRCWRMAPAH